MSWSVNLEERNGLVSPVAWSVPVSFKRTESRSLLFLATNFVSQVLTIGYMWSGSRYGLVGRILQATDGTDAGQIMSQGIECDHDESESGWS